MADVDSEQMTEDQSRTLESLGTEDFATRPVPMEDRRSLYATLTVWAGWTIAITVFFTGGLIGNSLPVSQAIPAILAGNAILAVVGGLIGYLGMKTGLSTYMVARWALGRYGSVIMSLIIGLILMGFVGVFAGATGTFIHAQFQQVPLAVGALLFVFLVVATASQGFRGLEYLAKAAVPLLWMLAIVALYSIGQELSGGLGSLTSITPKSPQGLSYGITLAVSVWITGASVTADIGRYAQNKWHVAIGSVGGYLFGAAFLESISAIAALGMGEGNIVTVMIGLGLFWPALVVFVLAMWTTADNSLYSFSLAFTNLSGVFDREDLFSKKVWVIIGGVLVWIGAVAGIYSQFQSFLLTISIVIPPITGILIARFYLLGDRHMSGDEIVSEVAATSKPISVSAVISWVVASLFAFFITWGSPAVNALILSAVLYSVLYRLLPREYR